MQVTIQGPSKAQLQGHDRDTRDWDLVVKYMHHSGECADTLTDAQHWAIYTLADGFGDLFEEPGILAEINDGYDWSHVRDSSASGVKRMALGLRALGFQ